MEKISESVEETTPSKSIAPIPTENTTKIFLKIQKSPDKDKKLLIYEITLL